MRGRSRELREQGGLVEKRKSGRRGERGIAELVLGAV